MRQALAPLAVVVLALSGCALLGKSEPVVPRYFAPVYEGATPSPPARPGLQLRLGRVVGWSHLRERIAARSGAREYSFYEDRRWLERPEIYLRRALSRTLFEERGVVEAVSGRAVTLEVELIAFEEVEQPRAVRLQARLVLLDDRVALLSETVTVEEPVGASADAAGAAADAFSSALRAGVTRIADRVVAKLAERPASPEA